jgi:hypothetical protein
MTTETAVALPLLDRIRIASPCPMRWGDLTPIAAEDGRAGDRVRYCGRCGLDVHNISNMTRDQAESLLASIEAARAGGGRFCAGFYRRVDGTVLTRDCPVGRLAVRRRARLVLTRIAALATLLVGGGALAARKEGNEGHRVADLPPFCWIGRVLHRSGAVPEPDAARAPAAPAAGAFIPGEVIFPLPHPGCP